MNVHFIAIGGSAMHNLAIALHKKGYHVTGSDDEVFEPSKGRLASYGLLPAEQGWDEAHIHQGLDAVILGMHARVDNPELRKARQLGVKIYSFPEFLYEQSKDKTRVVIGGSHGKTSITAMILHVLQHCGIECDYMVGAQLEGFEVMVRLSDSARYMILEGDEYLTSPIDLRPKFHVYQPDVALMSGIAWDHINVFPTFDNYVEQFRIFANMIADGGALVYCEQDEVVKAVCEGAKKSIQKFPYHLPPYTIHNGITSLITGSGEIPLKVFGRHNLMNLNGARLVCRQLGVDDAGFYEAIRSFSGASKRLELVKRNEYTTIYKDFAHSPSKLKATTAALKEQYPQRTLVACMELHTFSSLSLDFLSHYDAAMQAADQAIVYFSPRALAHKKLPPITVAQVEAGFNQPGLRVFTDSAELENYLVSQSWQEKNLLLMSSGNFDGVNFSALADQIIR